MKLFLDCLPCLFRQVLEAAYLATEKEVIHERIMDEAIQTLSNYRSYSCAPKLCEAMHAIVKRHTGVEDPYAKIKLKDISEALRLEPLLKSFAFSANDEELLLKMLKISATGNVMDSALYKDLDIEPILMEELKKPFAICDKDAFEKDLKKAKQVLIIGDNAGETVFDKFLVKYLAQDYEVFYAVREKPIINDATLDDAIKAGISDYATVVSSGCKTPGAVLELCNSEFKELFKNTDIVISKGQGNFEALSDTTRKIYFLLKAKCFKIAKMLDVEVNEYIFIQNTENIM